MSEQASIQDLIGSENHCHGCGPNNPQGLRIKSHLKGAESVCLFKPLPHHCAGSTEVLNGGIIASLIDCHCVNTAMAQAYIDEGREIGSDPKIWYVTATLQVSYLKPTAITKPVEVRARIVEKTDRKTKLTCSLLSEGIETAKGDVLAVRIRR